MSLISVENLTVHYEGRSILHDVSLSIEPNEIVTLIGPNGAGKSSLIRAMIGVVKPSQGRVERAPNLRVGYVPQKLETTANMPMRVSRFLKNVRQKDPQKRAQIIQTYGLEPLLTLQLQTLSGGEMRRVLFAHALLEEPNLLILDEPTAGLDMGATAQFYKFIEDLREKEKIAILLVSHDLNVVMRASDRVICLNGHICCEGVPSDVSQTPEFTELMGVFDPVALYEHHHDHVHDDEGLAYELGNSHEQNSSHQGHSDGPHQGHPYHE